jgi:cell division protease FtsH
VFLGRDFQSSERLSEETAQKIDAEIRATVLSQYERAKQILSTNRESLEKIADALLEYETIDGADIELLCKGGKMTRPLPTARPTQLGTKDEEAARNKRPLLPISTPKAADPEPEPV